MEEKIILAEDVKIEYRKDISGYVVAGKYYGADMERAKMLARYDVATHKKCEDCGEVIEIRSYCEACHQKSMIKKYNDMQEIEWNGEFPIAIYDSDTFFFNADDLIDYCYDQECLLDHYRFVSCYSVYAQELDEDYWVDDLPEDEDCIPEKLQEAVNKLNEVAKETLLCYRPSDKKLRFTDDQRKGFDYPR